MHYRIRAYTTPAAYKKMRVLFVTSEFKKVRVNTGYFVETGNVPIEVGRTCIKVKDHIQTQANYTGSIYYDFRFDPTYRLSLIKQYF